MNDLLIKNCKLSTKDLNVIRDILIVDGKIRKIGKNLISNVKTFDVCYNHVIPGLVDSHVHFRDFEQKHKEDWLSGSIAALSGGVTTVMDMPNNNPSMLTLDLLKQKRRLAKKTKINSFFHFGSSKDNLDEIRKASLEHDVVSTKIYMNHTTGNLLLNKDEDLDLIFRTAKIISVHAESEMLKKAIKLAKKYHNYLYVCHVSSRQDLDIVKKAKQELKNRIFCEVTPHHLFLTENEEKKQGVFARMMPSLKSGRDVQALWKAIADGYVDTIGTDHAPHTIEEKKKGAFGVPGVETILPLLLDSVNNGVLSLTQVVRLCSSNPAEIFGLKNKGKIKPGYDGDLVVIDMNKRKKVEHLKTKCGWSPFTGKILKGWPLLTIIKGEILWGDTSVF